MAVQDDNLRDTVGYQAPNVKQYRADDIIVRLLAANDPNVAGVTVCGYEVMDMNEDWAEKIGSAIGRSTNLRKLTITGTLNRCENLHYFIMWLAHNRSIEDFELFHFDFAELEFDMIRILAPFFALTTNLRSIDISRSKNLGERIPSLISALFPLGRNRFERIDFGQNEIKDQQVADFINALNATQGLHNLLDLDLSDNEVERAACLALSRLLESSECRLHTLAVSSIALDDECIGILINALAKNQTLKSLSIWSRHVTQAGWQLFFVFLSSPRCLIEQMVLGGEFGDECAASLGESLAVNQTMKSLNMSWCTITPSGCQEFSKCLRAPASTLVELNLQECLTEDIAAVSIFEALVQNTTLKELVLTTNNLITSGAWETCFRLLVGSQSAFEKLYVDCCEIDDEGANILVNLLSRQMRSVRLLIFGTILPSPLTDGVHLLMFYFPTRHRDLRRCD